MIPYFIMLGLPAIFSALFMMVNYKERDKKIIDIFFLLWLPILLLRSNKLGADLPVYEIHFDNYSKMSWNRIVEGILESEFETGFAVLSKIIGNITDSFHILIIICALISVVPIWKLYRKNAKHAFLMIVLFVNIAPFAMYFSGLRQAMAMAFVMPCYYFCKEKKILQFIVIVFVAYLIHKSAVILLVMYPVYNIKIKKKESLFFIGAIILLVNVFKENIFRFSFLIVDDKYERYLEGIHSTGAYAVLLLLIVLLIYSYIIVDEKNIDSNTIGLRNLLILSVLIQIFASIHTIAMRMNYYYLLLIPILIPQIIEKSNSKYRKIVELSILSMCVFFFIYYFYYAYTDEDILGIYPYKSFLSDI